MKACRSLPYLPVLSQHCSTRALALSIAGLLLVGCEKTLDHETIAQAIQQDVIKQGGTSLKQVTCPQGIKLKAEAEFECIGEIDSGYTFAIPVKQKDDAGNVTWAVPNARGLLNLANLETQMQEALTRELGARPVVDCGDGSFKGVKPGQTFDCKLEVKPPQPKQAKTGKPLKAVTVKPKQPDIIRVVIDTDTNVNWQRIMAGALQKSRPATQTAAADPVTPAETESETAPAQPAAPAQTTAEDFVNQPGATAGFED